MFSPLELLVLSFAVKSRIPPKATGTVVIAKKPAIEFQLPNVEAYRRFGVFKKLPTLSEDAVLDLLVNERASDEFEQPFDLHRPSVFLGDEALKALFRGGRGWETFYETYPESGGCFHVSRVGFSSDRRQALVHVGRQWHGRAGGGELIQIGLEKDAVVELGSMATWMS
jgi:hypothetical protein